MATGVKNSQLLDLLNTTLPDLPDNEFEVAWDYEDYEVVNRWFRRDRVDVDGGTTIDRRIMLDDSGAARYVRLYEPSQMTVNDVLKKTSIPWCQLETNWSVHKLEVLRNRSSVKGFIKLLMARRVDAMVALANMIEDRAWETPDDEDDDKHPFGLPYWLCLADDGTTSEGGFIGKTVRFGDGSTSNTRAGLSSSKYDKWRNWAATYEKVNRTLVKRMRKAALKTRFRSPMIVRDIRETPSDNYRIYMGSDTLIEFEEQAHAQNDNLGADIARYRGATLFNRIPMVHIPQLDDYTIQDGGGNDFNPEPIFGVNHNKFYPIVQEDFWLAESEPQTDRQNHNVFTTFVDGAHQYFCSNLRTAGWAIHKKVPSS